MKDASRGHRTIRRAGLVAIGAAYAPVIATAVLVSPAPVIAGLAVAGWAYNRKIRRAQR